NRSPLPTARSTRCSRRSRTTTRCNADSAPPAFSCRSPISLSAIPIRPKLRWWRCSAAISAAVPAMPASFPPCSKPPAAATRRHEERAMNKPQGKPDAPAKQVYREPVTIAGKTVGLAHEEPPVINAGVLENADIFRLINIFSEKFTPSNLDKADGTPLRLYTSDRVKVDVSKRRKHDMGFWHRNIDAHEIIFCVKGALKWDTELAANIIHPVHMLLIPHRT